MSGELACVECGIFLDNPFSDLICHRCQEVLDGNTEDGGELEDKDGEPDND
tara:strand:- start:27836 stop:27988 length:153 start_codon:yes stop_codon:yes gene_type:complete